MARETELVNCWVRGVPSGCEQHHITPEEFGGTSEPGNLIPICRVCHDIIDRYRWQRLEIWSWFFQEQRKGPGLRWARLMLLECMKMISWLKYKGYIVHRAVEL
ncbi:MAG: HNH endonuclease [Acidobacteriia bacterium]|nr:HNH endonuclease [Terriglobia bacterium]